MKGELVELDAEGLQARAFQHELDHLDGKLFIDYLGPLTRASLGKQVRQFEKNYADAQLACSLASTADLQLQVNALRSAAGVPEPVLPPRLPASVERPSGAREATA